MSTSPLPVDAGGPVRRVFYFADPMCSWCWGFSPVITAIRERCAGIVPVRLCVGGLRAFETQPMSERAKAEVREHWESVAAETGQPFDFAFFARDHFVYDTEPACRALVGMRVLHPPATLDYLAMLQRAFYAENRDITEEAVLADLASAFVSIDDFHEIYRTPDLRASTYADFEFAQRLGVGGFPTVVLQTDRQLNALCIGWQPFAAIEATLAGWLAG